MDIQADKVDLKYVIEIIKFLWVLTMSAMALAVTMFWRLWKRVEESIVSVCEFQKTCREELPKRYQEKIDFKDWRDQWCAGREELWDALNHHHHDPNSGRVIRGDK